MNSDIHLGLLTFGIPKSTDFCFKVVNGRRAILKQKSFKRCAVGDYRTVLSWQIHRSRANRT